MTTKPQELPFANKIALVTGSGRGIGRAIALHFARNGADVIVNYFRNRGPAEETAAEIRGLGRKTLVVKANIGELTALNQLFEAVLHEFGGLDILINNAASGYNRPILAQKPKGWEWTMNINARAVLFGSQQAVPLMRSRGGGYIVNISSPGASHVLPDYVVVGASKAALEALTRYLAIELAAENIVVNAVSPGIVETEALSHFIAVQEDQDLINKVTKRIPAGRLITTQDVAKLVAFLCTPAAFMIRGQVILMDGGYTLPLNSITP